MLGCWRRRTSAAAMAPAQPYYYGPDQIGSTWRAFVSTASVPA